MVLGQLHNTIGVYKTRATFLSNQNQNQSSLVRTPFPALRVIRVLIGLLNCLRALWLVSVTECFSIKGCFLLVILRFKFSWMVYLLSNWFGFSCVISNTETLYHVNSWITDSLTTIIKFFLYSSAAYLWRISCNFNSTLQKRWRYVWVWLDRHPQSKLRVYCLCFVHEWIQCRQ